VRGLQQAQKRRVGYNVEIREKMKRRGGRRCHSAENTYDYIGNLALHESPAATNAYTANNLNNTLQSSEPLRPLRSLREKLP
jgi:hypothetical protein